MCFFQIIYQCILAAHSDYYRHPPHPPQAVVVAVTITVSVLHVACVHVAQVTHGQIEDVVLVVFRVVVVVLSHNVVFGLVVVVVLLVIEVVVVFGMAVVVVILQVVVVVVFGVVVVVVVLLVVIIVVVGFEVVVVVVEVVIVIVVVVEVVFEVVLDVVGVVDLVVGGWWSLSLPSSNSRSTWRW